MSRPRLLVLSSTYPRWQGDSEPAFVHELTRRLSEQFRVTVLVPHTAGAAVFEHLDGVAVHRFRYAPQRWQQLCYQGGMLNRLRRQPLRALLLPSFVLAAWWQARALIRRESIDVVHAHWLLPMGLVASLPGLRRLPALVTSHGGDLFVRGGPPLRWLRKTVIQRANQISVVSNAMARSIATDKAHVIPMGTDLQGRFTPGAPADRRRNELLFVGRLVAKKGVDRLLEAMALIQRPELHLDIIGDGPERRALERQARALGFEANVRFLGAIGHAQLPGHLRRATLCVVPSVREASGDQEGFGLVLVEAMGCACPVLACDLPPIRDIVIPETTGLLCDCAPGALSQQLGRLLDQPELRLRLAANGRRHVLERFDWARISTQYAELISRTLNRSDQRL